MSKTAAKVLIKVSAAEKYGSGFVIGETLLAECTVVGLGRPCNPKVDETGKTIPGQQTVKFATKSGRKFRIPVGAVLTALRKQPKLQAIFITGDNIKFKPGIQVWLSIKAGTYGVIFSDTEITETVSSV